MNFFFYLAAAIALISTIMAISGRNAIHALLNLIISLLAVSVIFYLLDAPFIAALEVIIYAGAIMVLFIFVTMMLNIGTEKKIEKRWLNPRVWIVPSILAALLLVDFILIINGLQIPEPVDETLNTKQVGISLFSTYVLAVEIAGILLMAGVIGAYHLGSQKKKVTHRFLKK
ncbi:MAG TPA: NADH-quinone oxidoreductase subunit J [Bacteroidales bacterium]|jgi:NADH-quinone oxidoreductase subunit J|nr:NADH-quinone oxidoreductase subunit J [Bacteroidales bacterium]HNR42238.1 NADH-quinone oxidoreductase subunit J [Bacteroidales bacterium]HPM17555.1 NADH-quinone oxidoreductase subunit J [Bacteroidales bacterium]HPV16799.1 NADH-quinone oxidoreductase subunit J [Bacteroidales bacterium]HQG76945.1 NADH-quinone oxidoreductase subunit J [Bacteroidales bacterium]